MFHAFDTEVAERFGDTNIAVLFHNLCYWIAHNRANKKNLHTILLGEKKVDRYFTFNSIQAFSKQFPYWSDKQIRSYLNKLRENKFIHKATLNKVGFDRTAWYCLVDEDYWMNKYISEKGRSSEPEETQPRPEKVKTDDDVQKTTADGENMHEECINIDDEDISNSSICPNGQIDVPKRANRYDQTGTSMCPKGRIDLPKRENAFAQKGRPIPDINTHHKHYSKQDKKTTAAMVKVWLNNLDPEIILDTNEHSAAADFLDAYNLDQDYLSWLVQTIRPKVRTNLSGYFFSVYRRETYVNMYHFQKQKNIKKTNVEMVELVCPVCGVEYCAMQSDTDSPCPECGTPLDASEEQKTCAKALLNNDLMGTAITRFREIITKPCDVAAELDALKSEIMSKDAV